jgi:PAS domain S-box-containing protein
LFAAGGPVDLTALTSLPVGVLIADNSGRLVVYANPTLCRILNRPPDEIVGGDLARLLCPVAGSAAILAALADGNAWQGDLCLLAADGKSILADVTPTPYPVCPEPTHTLALVAPFSEARLAAARLAALAGYAVGPTVLADPGGRILAATPAAESLGLRPGTELLAGVHPDDLPDAVTAFATSRKVPDTPAPIRFRLRPPAGEWRELDGTIHDRSGDPILSGVVIALRDETDARRAERLQQELFERAVNGIFRSTEEGRFLTVNPSLARLYGYDSPEEVVALVHDIGTQVYVNPADRDEYRRLLAEQGEVNGFEFPIRRRDGDIRWVSESARPVRGPAGELLYYEGFVQDVTERHAAEVALRHSERQLRAVLDALPDIVIVLDREDRYREVHTRHPERLISPAESLIGRTVSEVLPPALAVRSSDLLAEARRSGEVQVEDIRVDLALDPDPYVFWADPSQVEQVLLNLVINVRDAMPAGGTLTVATPILHVPEGGLCRLTVRDTGCGMDETTLGRIFEPFFTTKGSDRGTGLGLATVYGIVTQSGGRIAVESSPGNGSTFHVDLPRAGLEVGPSRPAAPPPPGAGETVLLVEDDDSVRRLARLVLERQGYRVIEADTGAAALEVIRAETVPVDVVLTDLVLPDLDGAELAVELRRARPSLRVLFISGYPRQTLDERNSLPAGSSFIQKPFLPDDLTRKLRSVLDVPPRT